MNRPTEFYAPVSESIQKDSNCTIQSEHVKSQGLVPLDRGSFGVVLITPDGSRVIKFGLQMPNEYNNISGLQQVAAQYLPVPVSLRYFPDLSMPYALEMMNAGPVARWVIDNRGITQLEAQLCILQWIHCILLVGGRVIFSDQHSRNICLRWKGENIELRFIDAGFWELQTCSIMPGVEDRPRDLHAIRKNIDRMREEPYIFKKHLPPSKLWETANSPADLVLLAESWSAPNHPSENPERYRARLDSLMGGIREAAAKYVSA